MVAAAVNVRQSGASAAYRSEGDPNMNGERGHPVDRKVLEHRRLLLTGYCEHCHTRHVHPERETDGDKEREFVASFREASGYSGPLLWCRYCGTMYPWAGDARPAPAWTPREQPEASQGGSLGLDGREVPLEQR